MLASLVFIKIKERLNKIDSADYDNIECWQAREAFNKAQLEWVRRQIHGKNDTQEGDEETQQRVNDLEVILTSQKMIIEEFPIYFQTREYPTNCLYVKRVTPFVSKGSCKNKRIKSTLREESNVDEYLQDYSMRPSFDFEETFHTLINNKIRVYANNDFDVNEVEVIFYRYPIEIDFGQCQQLDGSSGEQVDPEFKDDIVELIIDDAVSILAGDIESPNANQIAKQRSEFNN